MTRAKENFKFCLIIWLLLKYKNIIKISLYLTNNLSKVKERAYTVNVDQ